MDRRSFLLSGAFGVAVLGPAAAAVDPTADLRGTIDPAPPELRPGLSIDQGEVLQRMLEEAFRKDRPLVLPAGRFVVSGIRLPPRTRLLGVAGATRLVLGEHGSMITADKGETIVLRDPSSRRTAAGWRPMSLPSSISLIARASRSRPAS
jgi:hypothetical protein